VASREYAHIPHTQTLTAAYQTEHVHKLCYDSYPSVSLASFKHFQHFTTLVFELAHVSITQHPRAFKHVSIGVGALALAVTNIVLVLAIVHLAID
jgi:hypothetical protein